MRSRPPRARGGNGRAASPANALPGGPDAPWATRVLDATFTTWRGFRRVLGLVWEAQPGLTLALGGLNVAQGFVPAASAWLSKLLIDAVVAGVTTRAGSAALPYIGVLVAAQFLIMAFSTLASAGSNICQQLLQDRVAHRVQILLMSHANELDLIHFEQPEFYDRIQEVQRDVGFRPTAMVQTAFGLVRMLINFLSLLALLLSLQWFVAAAALVMPIPAFISSIRYGWQGYRIARRQSPLRRMMSYLTDVLTTDTYSKEVKLFGLGDFFLRRFEQLFEQFEAENRALIIRRYTMGALLSLFSVLTNGLTFLYVAFQALGGALSVGDLSLYVQAASGVGTAFTSLLSGFQSMHEHQLYLSTLFEVLDIEPHVVRPEHPAAMRRPFQAGIEFRDVTYAYEGKTTPALQDVSFTIGLGETVAIVGHNGAGKTTLVKLLARLYDPQQGAVLIDGRDAREYDPDELRGQFGVLFQDYVTYQLTARENIGVGQTALLADPSSIADAAEKSGAAAIIERLPAGYDTFLGKWFDGGVNLSGGEWQKVALGRAFMREAQVLILDEPSAALDARAESELFTRLRDLARGRTTVFISHRFSTVRYADRILVFERGALVEQGSHEDLMEMNGQYAELFNLQAASYR